MIFFIILAIGSGIAAFIIGLFKKEWFAPALIAISLYSAGLLFYGLPSFADKYLALCLAFGALIVLFVKKDFSRDKSDRLANIHFWIFILFLAYMLLEVSRGLFLYHDLRIVYWYLYYILIALLLFLLSRKQFSFRRPGKICLVIFWASLVYFSAYLLHGIFSEFVRGIDWFTLQGKEWSGTTNAMFPMIIALAAAFLISKEKTGRSYLLSGALISMVVLSSFYYSSRISFLAMFVFLIVSLFFSKIARIIFAVCAILGALTLSYWAISGGIAKNLDNTYGLFFGERYQTWKESGGDSDRYLHLLCSLNLADKSVVSFISGQGFYAHRYLLSSCMQKSLQKSGISNYGAVSPDVPTNGFSSLLVDAGWLGVILFVINFILTAAYVVMSKISRGAKAVLVYVIIGAFLWQFIDSTHHMVLLYLLIMPYGLIYQLVFCASSRVKAGGEAELKLL